jgi:hypothetical protein
MGHLLKIKCVDSRVNVHNLASTSVPFTLTTVQVPNLETNSQKTDNNAPSLTEPDTDCAGSNYMRRPDFEDLDVDNHSHPPLFTIFIVSRLKEFSYLEKCCYLDRCYYSKKPFLTGKVSLLKKVYYVF